MVDRGHNSYKAFAFTTIDIMFKTQVIDKDASDETKKTQWHYENMDFCLQKDFLIFALTEFLS